MHNFSVFTNYNIETLFLEQIYKKLGWTVNQKFNQMVCWQSNNQNFMGTS